MIVRTAPRVADLALSGAAWLAFNGVVVWTVLFLADVVVPRTVDGPPRAGTAVAVLTDLGLLLLFAVQHSVMARGPVKEWMRQRVPVRLERTVYVLATGACLVLLLAFWQPFGSDVWRVHGLAAAALWALCGAGWLLAVAATYAVDHFALTGLRQAGWRVPAADDDGRLHVGGLHAVVRHPLMTGMLIAFWATPHLGASHLLFAAMSTGYIALGVQFEERDLRRTFPGVYDAYAATVPAVVPGLIRPRRRVSG